MLYYTTLYYTMIPYHTIPSCAILYYTMLYYTIYYTILYQFKTPLGIMVLEFPGSLRGIVWYSIV